MRIEFNTFRKRRIKKWLKRADWHWKFAFCKKIGPRKFMILEWYGQRYPHSEIYWKLKSDAWPENKEHIEKHRGAMRKVREGCLNFPPEKEERAEVWIDDIAALTRNLNEKHIEICFKEDLAKDVNGVLYNVKEAMDELDGKQQPVEGYARDILNRLENQ